MEYSDALCRGYLTHVQPVNNGAELTLTWYLQATPEMMTDIAAAAEMLVGSEAV
jgi:hypothetical protein